MKNQELPFVQDMFDAIAPKYDFLNRFLSMRQDVMWRRRLINALALKPGDAMLDVACGTGDVMLEALSRAINPSTVIGVDFSTRMLVMGKDKVAPELFPHALTGLMSGNALALPFKDESFQAVTIAFGIRNITDKIGAMAEFNRCLTPGGKLAILELATPVQPLIRSAYLSYFEKVLPAVGALFSKHNQAYSYLPASVTAFPPAPDFAAQVQAAGFEKVKWQALTLGICNLFVAEKPAI